MYVEDEVNVALCVEEEAILEDAFMVGRKVSVEMRSGKVKDLPPPPITRVEVERSPFRKAFECSQKVELNGMLGVGCFKMIYMNAVPREMNIVESRWAHSCKCDEWGNNVKS